MRWPNLFACLPLALLMLAGCDNTGGSKPDKPDAPAPARSQGADSMASRDPASGQAPEAYTPGSEPRRVMQAQVVLDRLGFSSGVIDGQANRSFSNALTAFQQARGLAVTGTLDKATAQALAAWTNIPATRVVTIPDAWGKITFTALPEGAPAQARLTRLGYESMAEKLAERFHTTPEVIALLNPERQTASPPAATTPAATTPAPGQPIRVPNIGADAIDPAQVKKPGWLDTLRSLGVGTNQPEVVRIVVDESEGWLRAYDAQGRLVAAFTVSTGSEHDPLPIGDWKVKGVAYNPPFAYNPELFWDVDDSQDKQRLPPGPNGPVGVVWIDLTKDHYGIHGTPEPELIGRTESHGCVRLTNWDAARLALMVSSRTKVVFRK
jgi:lipoprotein-anchoring transpeptidase ErfK/SrfK